MRDGTDKAASTDAKVVADSPRWKDVLAGLSIAGLLLPEAVAYSGIANLPPQAGVIALFAGLLCYGVFGSSRFAIVSATSSSAAVLAAATASMSGGDPVHRIFLASGLVLLTGIALLLAGFARIGGITHFIARPVLQGFAFGLALVIIVKQIATIVGIHPVHTDMIHTVIELYRRSAEWHPASIVLGLTSLALLFSFRRLQRIPCAAVVIVLGIAAYKWLDLANYGIDIVGPISLKLEMPGMPRLAQAEWLRLAELAIALVLVLYAETYGAIRTYAMKHGDTTDPDRDMLTLGAANLLSGMLHGLPVGAGYSATSANEAAGTMSRLAGWTAAIVLLGVIATLLPFIALMPHPVLAAIVIQAVSHTLTLATFRPYFRWERDRLVVVSSVLAVVIFGILDGLLVAIGISLLLMLRHLSKSNVVILGRLGETHDYVDCATHREAQAVPGMLILRPEEALFFANAERIITQAQEPILRNIQTIDTVILSLEESPDLDSTSLQALDDFTKFVVAKNCQLILARLKMPAHEVLARLKNSSPELHLTELSVDDAVATAFRLRQERVHQGGSIAERNLPVNQPISPGK